MQLLQYLVDLHLAGIRYYDLFGRLATLGTQGLQFSNNVHSFGDLPEYNVLPVEPTGLGTGDEELATIGIGASICHR